jgi:hypothetical protein
MAAKQMKAEDQLDVIGNASKMWLESALDLLTANAELARASKETAQRFNVPFSRSLWPRLMMRAFAIECLIKAHFLHAGKKLYLGGKYSEIVIRRLIEPLDEQLLHAKFLKEA